MDYIIFRDIFNSTIFESSKKDLLEKVAKYPNRYIGLFRPTKPKAKLLQKKLNILIGKYGDDNLRGYFYFIDPQLIKNRNYYQTELQRMQEDYGVELSVCYGKELFKFLSIETVWDEIPEMINFSIK
ncbi:TPA: hypothetical protein EYP66_13490 [Candidatus Poribacteria bacterium]|nr:hypothetical protein [Candidatus Poribacteria bacterium]